MYYLRGEADHARQSVLVCGRISSCRLSVYPAPIDGDLHYVGQFAQHFGVSPDQLGAEHIRTYQLHLLQQQASKSVFIQTVCALRFLYETPRSTLDGRVYPVSQTAQDAAGHRTETRR
jgi:hypothetical protein